MSNIFDEAIKLLEDNLKEDDNLNINVCVTNLDYFHIDKALELGKLYKEYSDLQFEIIVSFSNHHNFVRGEEIQKELNKIAKKINELQYE